MKTNVYVDGFNLYYGALRNDPQFKWLNLAEMSQQLLPKDQINKIRYFTARVTSWPHNAQAHDRQDIYLRALRTIPNLTIYYGRFATRSAKMPKDPLTYSLSLPNHPERVAVLKTEEKRSDVNLATLLLVDCFDDDFEQAVVVSNDTDLALPIDMVTSKFSKTVGVVNPHRENPIPRELKKVATWHRREINKKLLARSQFPNPMKDDSGSFRRPSRWR